MCLKTDEEADEDREGHASSQVFETEAEAEK